MRIWKKRKRSEENFKMKSIHAYLTFNGNCGKAMTFYRECLGGELRIQTLGDSPLSENMPKQMRELILQAVLRSKNLTIVATDLVDDLGLFKGNSVRLLLICESEQELLTCFNKLAVGGNADYPPYPDYKGELQGMLKDRFGIHWLLNY